MVGCPLRPVRRGRGVTTRWNGSVPPLDAAAARQTPRRCFLSGLVRATKDSAAIWPFRGFFGGHQGRREAAFALLIVLACLERSLPRALQKRENPRKNSCNPPKNQYNGSSNQRAPKARFPKTRKGARTMKKRCLALLLTLVLCIGMAIPAGASQFRTCPTATGPATLWTMWWRKGSSTAPVPPRFSPTAA